jgi:hypothetical protein
VREGEPERVRVREGEPERVRVRVRRSIGSSLAGLFWGRTGLAGFIVFGAMVGACNELRPRAATRMAQETDPDAGDSSGARSAGAALTSGSARHSWPRWPIENSCARTWTASADGDLAADLLVLASLCAPGLAPLRPIPFEVNVDPRDKALVPLSFQSPSACFRVIAASSVEGIEVSVSNGDDVIAGAFSPGRVVVVPPDGPVCLRDTQGLRLAIRSPSDRATPPTVVRVATNVWFAQGE